MKQLCRLVFHFVVIAVLLPGCGKRDEQVEGKVTITFWHSFVSSTIPSLKELISEFEKEHPQIRIKAQYVPTGDGLIQKLVTAVQSNTAPDVSWVHSDFLDKLVEADAIFPMKEFIDGENGMTPEEITDIFPALLESGKWRGKLYAMPMEATSLALLYNKEHFRKAGLDPNKPPTTWDELLATAQKATVRDATGKTITWGLTIPDDIWLVMSFILQNGGRTSSPDFKKVYLGEKPAVEAVQFWADMANKHKVMPRHRTFPISVQDFVAGNTAMLIHSTGNLRFVRDSAKFEWGTAFLPKNKRQAVAIGGAGFYIFKKASKEKQEAAWQFAKFATSPEIQARWNIGSGYIATRKSSFDLPLMKEYTGRLPQALVARDQLPYALPEMSTHDNWKMRNIFVTTFQEILDEKYTPEEGMKKAQAEIEKVLAPYQK